MKSSRDLNRFCRFRRYFICFHLFGLNACHPRNFAKQRIIYYFPSIVALFLLIYCEHFLTAKRFKRTENENGMILHSIMLINMTPSVCASIESFRMPNGTRNLKQIYSDVINYIEKLMSVRIAWDNFHREIYSKFKLVLICFSVTVFFRLWLRSPLYGRVYELSSAILWLYRTMTVLHSIFYVDLLTLLISSISLTVKVHRKIIAKRKSPKKIDEITDILRNVKHQHMKLWECGQIINEYFGWTLLIVVIDSAFTVTNDGYWLFLSVTLYGRNIFFHLRKYAFSLS